jgi:hypothetical protein
MSVINSTPLLMGEDGYQISRSVRLRSSASAYFNRTPASATNQTTWTWSGWVKRGILNSGMLFGAYKPPTGGFTLLLFAGDTLQSYQYNDGTGQVWNKTTTQVLRDPSAWYHVVLTYDSTNATASDRVRLYLNGSRITAFSTSTDPSSSLASWVNTTNRHTIGNNTTNLTDTFFDGYLTEVNFIDGQALTPSSFGETDAVTGVWKPKKYAGTYGTNGFYLNFSDNSNNTAATIGKDYSGNGNNWTPNNISVTAGATYDSMLDVPTPYADGGNGRGNYAVLNPIWKSSGASTSNANLTFSQTAALDVNETTIGVSSGKWYWETTVSSVGATPTPMIGVINGGGLDTYTSANAYYYYGNSGQKFIGGTASSYGATYTTNDVIGIALDMDAGTLTFYKNNVSQGAATTGLVGAFFPAFSNGGGGTPSWSGSINFGQRPFAYTPPTGFKALNTQNLPDATIKKGNQYFDVALITGNGGVQSVSGIGFQPDFVWWKNRTSGGGNHILVNSVTGIGNYLKSNSTSAEAAGSGVTSFNSDGLSVNGSFDNTYPFVNWLWKESITSGFDIVTYTGNGSTQNVAHSLGVAPKMIFVKARSGTSNWTAYHTSLGNTSAVYLNLTNAVFASSVYWNNTSPTSTQFTLGSGSDSNSNGVTYVAYLFAEVAGYSKFGSVTMNGSADGAFVFTGFLPKLVMLKRTDSTSNWIMWDTVRNTYNVVGAELYPNLSNAESTVTDLDILSNGFKMRNSGFSGTWIYAAWADAPFKNSLAR